jgi:molybdopterin-guanine dinucleotide biosynthesis protein B
MKIFTFAGWSKSGKTSIIAELIKVLKKKGKTVISVKKVPHAYHLQADTKDSSMFLNAGSDEVYLVAAEEIVNMRRVESADHIFHLLENHCLNPDYVLMEGVYHDNVPLIEVWDADTQPQMKFPLEKMAAVVSDQPVAGDIPCFPRDDIQALVTFMEEYHG